MSEPEGVRQRLLSELAAAAQAIARLERAHGQMIEASESSNADDEHDPEGATIAYERQQLESMTFRARRSEADLRAALAELDAGTYGRCERCGNPIGPERLEARPQARTCIGCARSARNR